MPKCVSEWYLIAKHVMAIAMPHGSYKIQAN